METSPAGRPDTQPAGSGTDWITVEGTTIRLRHLKDGGVLIGNVDQPGDILHFTKSEWAAWVDGVKAGEFDL